MINFEDPTKITELLLEHIDRRIRVEWLATVYGVSDQIFRGGMVFMNNRDTSFINYVFDQLEHQADEAGVQITGLIIGEDEAFPNNTLEFERDGAFFIAKTSSTGRCVSIF